MNWSVGILGAALAATSIAGAGATEASRPSLVIERGDAGQTWPINVTTKPRGPKLIIHADGIIELSDCEGCELHTRK
jgi:hypothetical protein